MLHRLRLRLNALIWRPLTPIVVRLFHKLTYFHRRDQTWKATTWLGVPVQQIPSDLWVKQEIIYETRPDLIIELGTFDGGSAMFYASLFDLLGNGEVISVDIAPQSNLPTHPRIEFITASSVDPAIFERITPRREGKKVMVILDSDHSRDHVRKELDMWASCVTKGCYLIVEDTNVNGHPVLKEHGPGPMEALDDWLKTKPPFENDPSREKYMVTFHPRGFWRRV